MKARKAKGISKAEVARRLEIPYTTYDSYERGDRNPNFGTYIKIIQILGLNEKTMGNSMKKTIKTADLLAYLTGEIEVYEGLAEKMCKRLEAVENGEKSRLTAEQIEARWKMLEHKIEALGTVKNHVMYILAKDEEKR